MKKPKFDGTDALVFGAAALAIGLLALLQRQGGSINVLTANPTTTSAMLSEAQSYNQDATEVAIAQLQYGAANKTQQGAGPYRGTVLPTRSG